MEDINEIYRWRSCEADGKGRKNSGSAINHVRIDEDGTGPAE